MQSFAGEKRLLLTMKQMSNKQSSKLIMRGDLFFGYVHKWHQGLYVLKNVTRGAQLCSEGGAIYPSLGPKFTCFYPLKQIK